jgi:hypothetical protein
MFFFEKKNIKLFLLGYEQADAHTRQVIGAKEQKFFASFFQKRRPSFSSDGPARYKGLP